MAFRTNKTPVLQEKSASGAVATFNTALAMPLASCNIAVNAWQEGSGTPSPDNVRTINGYSTIHIQNTCGINQWDEQWEQGGFWSGGQERASTTQIRSKDYISVFPNTTYYFQGNCQYLFGYDANKNLISALAFSNNRFTMPNNCRYIRFCTGASYGGTYNNDISINYPSTDTSYHAFVGQSVTIQIGSTVYGGEYDARTGVLTVTHGYIASYNGEVINEPWISSMDKYVEGGIPTSGAQVVYLLTTPTTIQLPPCPIDTLEGVNNIWADTGDIDLTYNDLDIAKRGNFREVFKLPS